jgi:hypothetical protein
MGNRSSAQIPWFKPMEYRINGLSSPALRKALDVLNSGHTAGSWIHIDAA